MKTRVRSAAGVAGFLLALLAPSGATAADTFVDATRPDNSGDCLTPATACQTISGPTGAMFKAGVGDTVFVADPAVPTTYAENVFVVGGRSVVALSPDPAETIIDNGDGGGTTAAIFVPPPPTGAPGGSIEGFTIRSDEQALIAQSPITISGNVFDEGTPPAELFDVRIDPSADGSLVTGNEFSDPTPTGGQNQQGLRVIGTSTISHNSFVDFVAAISGGTTGATPTISNNQISGTRVGANAGVGIIIIAGNPTITGNRIDGPFYATPTDFVSGISIDSINPGGISGATLRRNVVIGHRFGITIEDTSGQVTLESDLVVQSRINGLRLNDTGADDPAVSDATATNVTIVDTDDPSVIFESEALLFNANLTLDSSIIGAKAIEAQGSSVCAISFSRGPTTSGSSCQAFQTSADPLFNDYHLTSASTLVDAGNPAPPALGALDIDGDPRAQLGKFSCPLPAARRDIGADELNAVTPAIGCPAADKPETKKKKKKKKKCKKKRKKGKAGASAKCKKKKKKKKK